MAAAEVFLVPSALLALIPVRVWLGDKQCLACLSTMIAPDVWTFNFLISSKACYDLFSVRKS